MRAQLSEDVAAYVRELIISGQVRPGDFLRTEPIASAVGVSNTPVREGLLLLSGEGFVELVPRRGFVVADFSPQDVHDLFWAQAALGAELASRAARNITDEQLTQLTELYARHLAAMEVDASSDAAISLGHEFHRTINLAGNSRRLAQMLGMIVKQLPNRFYNDIEGHVEDICDAHPKILAALREHDAPRAGELMRDHIMSGAQEVIAMLRKQGIWDESA
ncbi:putative GntR family transcriptional regulator [Gordonia effusa NBRC 100432]|uniref:Putative GntR family transcriptional regulator n=1 Tax=Gordonia effusa NBRC 100432 TaxID=1077974 RepID=H0R3H6_9ACTN|nr:GntR family transcriptional regulator [Gordonia effusa]GAB19627.1 putative GntR family transcriptional regulator [Gordonia effusa NBRC 100432]